MDFKGAVRPIDMSVSKVVLIALAIIVLAVGVSIFSFIYLLVAYDVEPAVYGIILIWVGSMAFFYAVITEEHTMKELFMRQGYFFTGLISMIMGMFFITLAGFSTPTSGGVMEFGLLLLIFGAGLTLLSAQRTRDYSKRGGFLALFGGVLLMLGGLIIGNLSIAYAGVFITILSAIWLGLRSRYAV